MTGPTCRAFPWRRGRVPLFCFAAAVAVCVRRSDCLSPWTFRKAQICSSRRDGAKLFEGTPNCFPSDALVTKADGTLTRAVQMDQRPRGGRRSLAHPLAARFRQGREALAGRPAHLDHGVRCELAVDRAGQRDARQEGAERRAAAQANRRAAVLSPRRAGLSTRGCAARGAGRPI